MDPKLVKRSAEDYSNVAYVNSLVDKVSWQGYTILQHGNLLRGKSLTIQGSRIS